MCLSFNRSHCFTIWLCFDIGILPYSSIRPLLQHQSLLQHRPSTLTHHIVSLHLNTGLCFRIHGVYLAIFLQSASTDLAGSRAWCPKVWAPKKAGARKGCRPKGLVPEKAGARKGWNPKRLVPKKTGSRKGWCPKRLVPDPILNNMGGAIQP
ncbi:hypothetical protein CALCODRAFT_508364 [Calocera cornea HHB12733]|uniref:Uncharacterized protein n=1 Tax=Calocera cornea HHB12733 TaxID=1353952 RepID=A0A165GHL9_9BASI|nr:hypothetical protein CALCODRAFT_508364 [Calocera cornea HHB12733]